MRVEDGGIRGLGEPNGRETLAFFYWTLGTTLHPTTYNRPVKKGQRFFDNNTPYESSHGCHHALGATYPFQARSESDRQASS